MKCRQTEISPEFEPIKLEIVIESKEEFLDLYDRLFIRKVQLIEETSKHVNDNLNIELCTLLNKIKRNLGL